MAIARIITRNPEEVVALREELRARGYEVETLAPGDLRLTPAEVEIVAEKVSRTDALKEARKQARRDDADLFISPNMLTDEGAGEVVERGNIFLDAPRAMLGRLGAWQAARAERSAAQRISQGERKRVQAEEAERKRLEREAQLAEHRIVEEKRREQEALERERRRTEEAERKRHHELALQREREERERLEAEERERRRIAQEENARLIAEERERIRIEQQREAEERQRQLAALAQRHEEEEKRRRTAPTVIAIRDDEPLPEPLPVTTVTPVATDVEQEREEALTARFRRIAHEEVTREMAQRGTAAVPVPDEDEGGIRKWKGAFAGAAAIAVALAIVLGFTVARGPEPAQAIPGATVGPNNGATLGPNTGVTLGPPTAPVKPNPPEAKKQTAPAPAPSAKPKARGSRRSRLDDGGIADDTVTVRHYAPVQAHITTAKNGVKKISDDQ